MCLTSISERPLKLNSRSSRLQSSLSLGSRSTPVDFFMPRRHRSLSFTCRFAFFGVVTGLSSNITAPLLARRAKAGPYSPSQPSSEPLGRGHLETWISESRGSIQTVYQIIDLHRFPPPHGSSSSPEREQREGRRTISLSFKLRLMKTRHVLILLPQNSF